MDARREGKGREDEMQSPKLSCSLSQSLLESYPINPHAVSRPASLHVCLLNVDPRDGCQKGRVGEMRCSPLNYPAASPKPFWNPFPSIYMQLADLHVNPRDRCQKGTEGKMRCRLVDCHSHIPPSLRH
jgi:hypothetical protein